MIIWQLLFLTSAAVHAYPQDELEIEIDHYINAYEKMNQFSGSIIVAQNDKIIINKGYGMANYEHDIPNNPQTVFRIGSLTKQFTAMAVMMLEEQGLLDIDENVSKYIPDYPGGDLITIKHLLTHTSGIPDHTELPDFNEDRRVYPSSIDNTISTFKNKALEFSPGEKFKYSSSGYILLGYIIEKVADRSYEDYINHFIFEPLQMSQSGFERPDRIVKYHSSGYTVENDEIVKAQYRNISNAHASGALYSTTEDMYLWDRALYTEKLITKKSLGIMFTPFTENYGLGWGVVDVFNRRMAGHNGETEGYRANITRFLNDDVCIIILSNLEQTQVGKMSIDLAAIIFGEKYSIPEMKSVVTVDLTILNDYVGIYELSPSFSFTISREDTQLFCQATGQDKFEIYPESETKFFIKDVDAQISFVRDENNSVEKLILHQGGRDIPAKKIG